MASVFPYSDGQQTLATGQPYQPFMPFQGMPGGPVAQIAAQQLTPMARAFGMIPTGYGYSGNLYNNLNAQMFDVSHRSAVASASVADRERIAEAVRGAYAGTDRRFGAEQERRLQSQLDIYSAMPPEIKLMVSEKLTGGRSATTMAAMTHAGGRYAMDPVTGFRGLSGATASHMSQGLSEYYFSDPEQWRRKSAGLTSSQIGGLYGELTRRGYGVNPGTWRSRVSASMNSLDPAEREKALREAGIESKSLTKDEGGNYELNNEQVTSLMGIEQVQKGIRSDYTGRAAKVIDRYKGAIKAVQEIFGEHGRPDAPMPELFNMLEQLTMGTQQQFSGAKTEMMVRNLYNATKNAGLGMEAVGMLMQDAGSYANQLGVNPVFASRAVEHGAYTRSAMQSIGLGEMNVWGLMSPDKLALLEGRRYMNAAASPLGNRLATLRRLSSQGVELGAFGNRVLKQMESGNVTPDIVGMTEGEFIARAAEGSGMTQTQMAQAVRHESLNEEYRDAGIVRRAQPVELGQRLFRRSFSRVARMYGANRDIAVQMAAAASDELLSMPAKEALDAEKRHAGMSGAIRARLESTEEGRSYLGTLGADREQQDRKLRMASMQMYGELETDYRRMPGGDPRGHIANVLALDDPAVRHLAGSEQQRTIMQSFMQSAARGMVDRDALNRLIKTMVTGGRKPDRSQLRRVLASAAGYTDAGDISERLVSDMLDTYSAGVEVGDEIKQLEKEKKAGGLSEEKSQRLEFLTARDRAISQEMSKLRTTAEKNKLAEEAIKDAKEESPDGVTDTAGGVAGAGISAIAMSNVTVNLNGRTVIEGGAGSVQRSGVGRGQAPSAGVA